MTRLIAFLCFALLMSLMACAEDEPVTSGPLPGTGQEELPEEEASEEAPSNNRAPSEDPARLCTTDAECEDHLDCTDDACGTDGHCVWSLQEDACLIDGLCYQPGDLSPENSCASCNPSEGRGAWTQSPNGSPCNDQSACTAQDLCVEGVCTGQNIACEDNNPCTGQACDPVEGCLFEFLPPGTSCNDENACTQNDVCTQEGVCEGISSCDDDNPCTDDTCGPDGTCIHTPNTGSCDDGNACTTGDLCQDGVCTSQGELNCDDGNLCTLDGCHEISGCFQLPSENPCCIGDTSICNDNNPCTTDLCDPETSGCTYENNNAACDDGNACTQADVCSEGTCNGDVVVCDDANPCTLDQCNPSQGCVTISQNDIACDDGLECSTGDTCLAGVCTGDTAMCVCSPTFGESAGRMTTLRFGTQPSDALDVNGDGIAENALSPIGSLVNDPLEESVSSGNLNLLLDFQGSDQNPFILAAYDADLASSNASCDPQTQTCSFEISDTLLHPETCAPLVNLSATLSGTTLEAGGPGAVFPFTVPIGGSVLTLTLYETRLRAEATIENGRIVSLNSGLIGGAVRRQDLLDAISALPADSLPLDPASVVSLLNLLVQDDTDTDGDGVVDAASLALVFETREARIVGVAR